VSNTSVVSRARANTIVWMPAARNRAATSRASSVALRRWAQRSIYQRRVEQDEMLFAARRAVVVNQS